MTGAPREAAAELARGFARTAAEHDRDGSFPFANLERLQAAGLLALAVPAAHGGAEAGLATVCEVVRELAHGDASTALIVAMQSAAHAGIAREPQWPPLLAECVFTAAVREGALVNVLGAEPGYTPARGGRPGTRATETAGGWSITGTKSYATAAEALAFFLVHAAVEPGGPVGFWLVPRGTPGIVVMRTWDQLGMRASGSHAVRFEDVRVPRDHVVERVDPNAARTAGTTAWWTCTLASVYAGIAEAAAAWLFADLGSRAPLPQHEAAAGEIEALLLANSLLLSTVLRDAEREPDGFSDRCRMVKHLVGENAIRAVDRAMRLAGLSGLSREHPLERHHRDVLYARLHPPFGDAVLAAAGRAALARRRTEGTGR